MNREKLTPDRIRKFACPEDKAQAFLWDTISPRLALRVTRAGKKKAFIFETKINRQTIRRTIGDAEAWTLEAARAEANRLQTLIDQDIDPRELDRQVKAEKAAAQAAEEAAQAEQKRRQLYTLRALCEAYVGHLESQGKARSAAATRSAFRCHVFEKGEAKLPAHEVTPHQIAALVRKVREAGKERAAGVLRAYLSAAFNCAKRAPYDSSLPSDMIPFQIEHNPVDAIPTIPVKRGTRTLSEDELKAYMGNLGADLADQVLLLALYAGGQRMAQLLRAKVSDWDPKNRTLRLWDGKGRRTVAREHLLPLGPKAAEIVQGLADAETRREAERAKEDERKSNAGACWLFSVHGRIPMTQTTTGKRVTEIAADLGGEPFDLRDIRRTCETMLASMGISKDVRAQLLSHGISGVQAANYDRYDYISEKRAALEAWEKRLATIQGDQDDESNVVQIASKRNTAA